jgi:hypothetical protein
MRKNVTTTDAMLVIYQDRDLSSSVVVQVSKDVEIQLGYPVIHDGREWMEATLKDGTVGYVLGPNARSHTTLRPAERHANALRTPDMQCPACGLVNPTTAQRCDCGFDFPSGKMKGSLLSTQELRKMSESPRVYVPVWWLRPLMGLLLAAHDRWSSEGRRRRRILDAYRKKDRGTDDSDHSDSRG